MEEQILFGDFVKECYKYGDNLANKKIRCEYLNAAAIYNDGVESFCLKLFCADGTIIMARMSESHRVVWLMVIKDEKINGKYKGQTRFADEYHTDLQKVFESIAKHVELHGGFKQKKSKKRVSNEQL